LRPLPFSAGLIDATAFWCAFALWLVFELGHSKTKRSGDPARLRDRGSLRLIAILWFGGIAADFWLSFILPQASITSKRQLAFAAGITLMLAGIGLRQYSMAILGKYFTFDVAVDQSHTLIEAGPYRYIRHPSYTGALLSLLGFGLALGNWAGIAVALSCMAIAYTYRIAVEENALSAALGDSYKQYRRRTWRLVPFLF
jgi:protein-S-isoprenylcysteine O-methyltransferase